MPWSRKGRAEGHAHHMRKDTSRSRALESWRQVAWGRSLTSPSLQPPLWNESYQSSTSTWGFFLHSTGSVKVYSWDYQPGSLFCELT